MRPVLAHGPEDAVCHRQLGVERNGLLGVEQMVVTIEGEAILTEGRKTYGGDLIRIAISRAEPLGSLSGWRPLAPVTQWSVVKP